MSAETPATTAPMSLEEFKSILRCWVGDWTCSECNWVSLTPWEELYKGVMSLKCPRCGEFGMGPKYSWEYKRKMAKLDAQIAAARKEGRETGFSEAMAAHTQGGYSRMCDEHEKLTEAASTTKEER